MKKALRKLSDRLFECEKILFPDQYSFYGDEIPMDVRLREVEDKINLILDHFDIEYEIVEEHSVLKSREE